MFASRGYTLRTVRHKVARCNNLQQRLKFSSSNRSRQQKLEEFASRSPFSRGKKQEGESKTSFLLSGSTALVIGGVALWGLVYSNHFFQKREKEAIFKAQEELYKEFGDLDEWTEKKKDTPALFYCVVRIKSRELKELFPVEIGELCEVLEEGMGQQRNLNMCRRQPKSPDETPLVFLYPMGCLQRLDTTNKDTKY